MEIVMFLPVLSELLQRHMVTKRQDVHRHPHPCILFSYIYSYKKLCSVKSATRVVVTAL